MPFAATVEDIEDIYFQAWKWVSKLAIYRDGCKRSQPTQGLKNKNDDVATGPAIPVDGYQPISVEELIEAAKDMNAEKELGQKLGMIERKRLPDERVALITSLVLLATKAISQLAFLRMVPRAKSSVRCPRRVVRSWSNGRVRDGGIFCPAIWCAHGRSCS